MNDQEIILALRLIHITFGVFWVGSVLLFTLFIQPTVVKLGPDGGKFMHQLGKSSFSMAMVISGLITIVAGILIMWKLSGGFEVAWFRSNYARVLSIGSGLSIIAFIIGFTVNRPAAARMTIIGETVARSASMPTKEQMAELAALRKRMSVASNVVAILLTLTVISMAICRYIN